MSFYELMIVLIVSVFALSKKDIQFLVKNFKLFQQYITSLKKELLEPILEDPSNQKPLPDEIEQMNFMLAEIISIEGKYEGDYSLKNIEFHYNRIKKQKKLK